MTPDYQPNADILHGYNNDGRSATPERFQTSERANISRYKAFSTQESFRPESSVFRELLKINVDTNSKMSAIIDQNKAIIDLLSLRRVPPTVSAAKSFEVQLGTQLLESASKITNNQKWKALKYQSSRQLFINELACDLASKSFFGDDILRKSNVLKIDWWRGLTILDQKNLLEIKQIVREKADSISSEIDFELNWGRAVCSLQNRCKNLRAGAVRMATSSELLAMSSGNLY